MFYDIYLYTLCYYICCLLWRMYEMHPALSLKSGCDTRRIHASPEGLLKQRAHPRLAQSPARAGFVVKQPWPNRLTNRPYRRRIQCKDRLASYPDTRASVGKVEVTAVTLPLY